MTPRHACFKCGGGEAQFYSVAGARCPPCFDAHVRDTFRRAVVREGMLQHGARVAVAVSGGPASMALLDLVLRFWEREWGGRGSESRQWHFWPLVLHVEVPWRGGAQTAERLRDLAETHNLPFASVRQEPPPELLHSMDGSERRQCWREQVRLQLTRMALDHNCTGLLLGTTATRAAVMTVVRMGMGEGWQAKEETRMVTEWSAPPHGNQVRAEQHANITVGRPLRELLQRDMVRYARTRPGLELGITHMQDMRDTLEGLAERFLLEMGQGRAATIHSVLGVMDRV